MQTAISKRFRRDKKKVNAIERFQLHVKKCPITAYPGDIDSTD
jgi:hypothetical protein